MFCLGSVLACFFPIAFLMSLLLFFVLLAVVCLFRPAFSLVFLVFRSFVFFCLLVVLVPISVSSVGVLVPVFL